jgi:hypothetical protein
VVVVVERCEAGSGGQKVDGGGRCEPDGQRERERIGESTGITAAPSGCFLVDPEGPPPHARRRSTALKTAP